MAEINTTIQRTREYRDISLTFAKNPVNNDIVSVAGVDAVKRAIKNILMTRTGEVPFFPNFGSRIHSLLFEPIDPITTALLQSEIQSSLETFEPRMKIVSIILSPDEEKNLYQVNLTIRLVNQLAPITVTLFLSRLR
jgi:phage baseplate assembly protein W